MKLVSIRKKIISNLVISGAVIAALVVVMAYESHHKKSKFEEAEKVQSEAADIKNKSQELQDKFLQAKKYQEIWKTISSNKKTIVNNLRIDDVNAIINKLADKYTIMKPAIKMTIPEELKGSVFQRSTVQVASSSVTLTFNSLNDTKAISFIYELINSAPGYIVISSLEMKKNKDYSDQDLIDISSGADIGLVAVILDFFWYMYKDKPVEKIQTPTAVTQPQPNEIPQ